MEHKVADPAPLGLAAFAMTTLCLSSANAGWWDKGGASAALALALIYGGTAQFAAGMWEFYILLKIPAIPASTDTVAIFLLGWTIFTLYMTVAAMKTNTVVLSVFIFLSLTFIALTIGNWGAGHSGLVKTGGYLGIVTAILAFYGSAAGVINETHGKVVLPVGPRNA
jgi:succinate-acetate transporter protein